MGKKTNSFLSFITGLSLGAIVGLLFAPESGDNTRQRLSFTLRKYKEKISALVDEMIKEQNNLGNKAKDSGTKVVNEVKKKAEDILNDVDNLINKIEKEEGE